MSKSFTYIILENKVLLSKKEYKNWREIQDDYYDEFMTSMGPWTIDEFSDYLKDDFKDEVNWPFNKQDLLEFSKNDDMTLISSTVKVR